MDSGEVLKALVEMSIAIAGFVMKFVVPLLDSSLESAGLTEKTREVVYTIIRIAIAILTVFGAGNDLNILQFSKMYGQLYPAVGLVITGILVGISAEALNFFFSLISMQFKALKAEYALRIYSAESKTNAVTLLKERVVQ